MGIRYSKDGDIETYDEKTGKTTGHITTMGNYCVPDEELVRQKKLIKELVSKRKEKENNTCHRHSLKHKKA